MLEIRQQHLPIGHYTRKIHKMVLKPNVLCCTCYQVPTPQCLEATQFASELDPPSTRRSPLRPRERDVPATFASPTNSVLPDDPLGSGCSPPPPPSPYVRGTLAPPLSARANMPLHHAPSPHSVPTLNVATTTHILLACIDICVVMVSMYITSTESCVAHYARRKKLRKSAQEDESCTMPATLSRRVPEEEALEHPHDKHVIDLLAWQVEVLDARWYVKPRSTCWFEEYLFNVYTPDMFYDILRMRRRTFDRLVQDLRPFILGQHIHWRQPISVEKKVVVTLFKLMYGASIPLVADKAALGKSTVSEILRQVCLAISTHFGHLIAWPVGRRLARTATAFQAKQGLPTYIGAIDGSHIYIASPSNIIVAADHRNRNKSFSILLQGVVDSRCYFTSINAGPPGSLHDSAHFKSSELYWKVEEGIMGGFHDDPLTWPSGLAFPPYIVADRGYPLLSWCITPFNMGPMGTPLSREET